MKTTHRQALCLLLLPLALAACSKKQETGSGPSSAGESTTAAAPAAEQATKAGPKLSKRFIALKHKLLVLTQADAVEPAWRSAQEACVVAECDILSSSITHEGEHRPASASIEVRVPPDKLGTFLAKVNTLGHVGQHDMAAEDRTDEVIDTEARQKNMATFRDHLRQMMATPGAKLADVIEIERELTRVQSEIDGLATRRQALSNETDKVRVSISFQAQSSMLAPGMWSPVSRALNGAGHVFAASIGGLIDFMAAVTPWLIVLVPAGMGLRALWRRRKAAQGR
jgi:hypothetical protein